MWAAANYGAARRHHRDKRWRADVGGDVDGDNGSSDSEESASSSSDGERSTTESVHDEPAAGAGSGPDGVGGGTPAPEVALPKRRKRRRRKKKRRQVQETPEATVARLTSSYSAAMAAVGALHRASRQYCASWKREEAKAADRDDMQVDDTAAEDGEGANTGGADAPATAPNADNTAQKLQEARSNIQRVATAARAALEKSLLLDPVVLAPVVLPENKDKRGKKGTARGEDVPTCDERDGASSAWLGAWDESSGSGTTAEGIGQTNASLSMAKWGRLNSAHRSAVRQISYLALVNYADLLLCGRRRSSDEGSADDTGRKRGVLDRGAVPPLDVLDAFATDAGDPSEQSESLWPDEAPERTVRLALAAYCDASDLDPADPTLWVKLACAARALGRCRRSTAHRRLERLALERGLSALPKGVPPNRLVAQAWREMERDGPGPALADGEDGDGTSREDEEPMELTLHLPRYSWAALGGMLVRACQEGASYGRTQLSEDHEFGSPLVVVDVSPLLAIPCAILGRTCEYLAGVDVKRLACTCRAASELVSRRDIVSEAKSAPVAKRRENDEGQTGGATRSGANDKGDAGAGAGAGADRSNATPPPDCDTDTTPASRSGDNDDANTPRRRGRVSKRVRSQMITSEKHTERKLKRSSVEYCLLSGALSCTAQNPHYTKALKAAFDWERLPLIKGSIQKLPARGSPGSKLPVVRPGNEALQVESFHGAASLNAFVEKWSGRNSGPKNLLEIFLAHIALNTEVVFDAATTEALSSCFIECFDAMISCTESHVEFAPWYGPETLQEMGVTQVASQVISVNLLNAELRMKRCESNDVGSQGHHEDLDALAFVVPTLLHLVSEVSQRAGSQHDAEVILLRLHCRCCWLATSYYLQVARCSNDTSVSRAAEDSGHDYLEKTMALLSDSPLNGAVKTPHLESPDRRGEHWSVLSTETLSKYRQHLESSAIVSKARQSYQEVKIKMQERSQEGGAVVVDAEDKAKLASLGIELLDRYNTNGEKASDALEELLNDFLLQEDHHLSGLNAYSSEEETSWSGEGHWTAIPSSQDASIAGQTGQSSRPSIIEVLASSLVASEEKIPSLFQIYTKLAFTALLARARLSDKQPNATSKAGSRQGDQAALHEDADADATKRSLERREQLMLVVNFFTDKLADMIASYPSEADLQACMNACVEGEQLCSIVHSTLSAACDKNDDSRLQLYLCRSISRLVLALRHCHGLSQEARERVESFYLVNLAKALILRRTEFADLIASATDKRLKTWQARLSAHAELVFLAANEIAELLSQNPSQVKGDGTVEVSHLIKALVGADVDVESTAFQSRATSPLAQLADALLFFYQSEAPSPAERAVRRRIKVPVSAAIVSLCGSPGVSIEGASKAMEQSDTHPLSFSDFFDSEASVNGLFLPNKSADEEEQQRRRVLLRSICQLVQCVSLVFGSVDEKEMSHASIAFPSSEHGPFLPLVVVRVLASLSDNLFGLFSENLASAYPYGARECGTSIDLLLGKACWPLFGFSLSNADQDSSKKHAPESLAAAWQIFRCIKRVYHGNRKSPPRKAFETVELALPPADAEASRARKAIKDYLFAAEKNVDTAGTDLPPGFPLWALDDAASTSIGDEDPSGAEVLRRHVTRELAKDPIHHLDSSQQASSDTDGQGLSEEREMTQSHEMSLHQKFEAVLDDLCYNPKNAEGWVNLSECLGFKADIISDRLVRVQESYASADFYLTSESKRQAPSTLSLEALKQSQLEEYEQSRQNWTPFIGDDLSVYMKYAWSNLGSLQAFAESIGATIAPKNTEAGGSTGESGQSADYLCWKEIQSMLENGDYAAWANAWAGMFVFALRTMKVRALLVARYIAKQSSQGGMHPSEISEEAGTSLYGDVMASTVYGYPMHSMTPHEKRSIAERSKFCFQEAIQLCTSSDFAQKSETVSWEEQFMLGKSLEKIASTLKDERYSTDATGAGNSTRAYEPIMAEAIRNYSEAYSDAKKTETSSSWTPDKLGGSSHGSLECLYRLHASRFKVLLSAIKRAAGERDLAELEAYRIASVAWFDESNNQSSATGVRGKTWDLFSDCVEAFSHCRQEVPLFHRAAYRLAQAYCWAPAFHDPDCSLSVGSKQAIPAIKSYRIRGLDPECCVKSASEVMSKLFEKRRVQLCAVWMTTSTAPTPFEVLNDSFRKYDALRWKYIRAYVDCLRLSADKDKMEALLNLVATTNQDLPSFYEASAVLQGGDPGKHSKQPLLRGSAKGIITKVKLSLVNAIAEITLADLAKMKKTGVDKEGRMKLTQHFKQCHALFLRLNSSPKQVAEFPRRSELFAVQAFCKCYLSIQSGYRISSVHMDGMDGDTLCSILEGAASKAKAVMQGEKAAKVASKKREER